MTHRERPLLLEKTWLNKTFEELRRVTGPNRFVELLAGHIAAQDEEIRDLKQRVDVLKENPMYYVDEVEAKEQAEVEVLIESIRAEIAKRNAVRGGDTV